MLENCKASCEKIAEADREMAVEIGKYYMVFIRGGMCMGYMICNRLKFIAFVYGLQFTSTYHTYYPIPPIHLAISRKEDWTYQILL